MHAIDWIQDVMRRNADREFLVDVVTGERLTYAALDAAARSIGADLRRHSVGKGDRVALLLHNSASCAKIYFGCLYAGAVTVPVNPVLSTKEIEFLLKHSGARLLVLSAETQARVHEGMLPPGGQVLVLHDGHGSREPVGRSEPWDLQRLPAAESFTPFDGMDSDDTMTIVYTSGTTATPSGVVHRIADLIDNARLFNRRLGIGPQNRFYGILAMSYLGGYYNLLLLPFAGEASVVLNDAFDARLALNMWAPARDHGVNTLWLVPTILSILMQLDRGTDGEKFCRESVRLALVGTAPLPVPLRREFESRYGLKLHENYGLSETLFISTGAPTLAVPDGCVGRLLPGVQVTVLDGQGAPQPYGAEGEINVCTPHLMQGYYDPSTRAPGVMAREDWFPTGDIGVLKETGDLYITGRKKDLIIRGGVNVSPASLENVIYSCEGVAECAVVGIPHALHGEDIAAVVRLAPGHEFEPVRARITSTCQENLGVAKQPAVILELEEFPHSSSGKIQKRKVRELLIHKLGLQSLAAQDRPAPAAVSAPDMIPGVVRRAIVRPPEAVVRDLAQYSVSLVSDCLNRLGCMDGRLRALVRGRPFAGPAVTVEEVEGGNLMSHAALEIAERGDVLVIDAKGVTSRASWGGLQTRMARDRGLAAVVVFGAVRDFADVVELGLPVYAIGTSPGGPLKGWGGSVNVPVACAGVAVQPGDVVMGDDDGVVVVPRELAAKVPAYAERRRTMEAGWLEKVKAGRSTLEAVGLRSRLEQHGIRYD